MQAIAAAERALSSVKVGDVIWWPEPPGGWQKVTEHELLSCTENNIECEDYYYSYGADSGPRVLVRMDTKRTMFGITGSLSRASSLAAIAEFDRQVALVRHWIECDKQWADTHRGRWVYVDGDQVRFARFEGEALGRGTKTNEHGSAFVYLMGSGVGLDDDGALVASQ